MTHWTSVTVLVLCIVCSLSSVMAITPTYDVGLNGTFNYMFTSQKYAVVAGVRASQNTFQVFELTTGKKVADVPQVCNCQVMDNHCSTVAINDKEDQLYYSACDGVAAYSFAASTGVKFLWKNANTQAAFGPQYALGYVMASYGGYVYGFNATTGTFLWSYSGNAYGQPVIAGDLALVGDYSAGLVAITITTGKTAWYTGGSAPARDGSSLSIQVLDFFGKAAYFYAVDNTMRKADLSSGAVKWTTKKPFLAPPTTQTYRNNILWTANEFYIYAYNGTGITQVDPDSGDLDTTLSPGNALSQKNANGLLMPNPKSASYIYDVVGKGMIVEYWTASGTVSQKITFPKVTELLSVVSVNAIESMNGDLVVCLTNEPSLLAFVPGSGSEQQKLLTREERWKRFLKSKKMV